MPTAENVIRSALSATGLYSGQKTSSEVSSPLQVLDDVLIPFNRPRTNGRQKTRPRLPVLKLLRLRLRQPKPYQMPRRKLEQQSRTPHTRPPRIWRRKTILLVRMETQEPAFLATSIRLLAPSTRASI